MKKCACGAVRDDLANYCDQCGKRLPNGEYPSWVASITTRHADAILRNYIKDNSGRHGGVQMARAVASVIDLVPRAELDEARAEIARMAMLVEQQKECAK